MSGSNGVLQSWSSSLGAAWCVLCLAFHHAGLNPCILYKLFELLAYAGFKMQQTRFNIGEMRKPDDTLEAQTNE